MTITNYSLAGLALLSTTASAFPHIARQLDFDVRSANGAESFGPSYARNEPAVQNIERRGAVPLSSAFPYNGAKNGLPSQGKGGYQVPAPGDNAHRFIAPGPNDIRGPCPGTNAMANHGFIDRSGRTTFNELVDGSQNAWNLGWDLAVFLAGLEVALSGNALTGAISIGKPVPGVSLPVIGDIIDNGNNNGFFHHNGWESDGSMAWQDQAIATKEGMDPKLFEKMVKTINPDGPAEETVFNFDGLARYRAERYQDCINENPQCFWGPYQVILYGAATFPYEIMGNSTYREVAAAFGYDTTNGQYIPETFPEGFRTRATPYTFAEGGAQIAAMFLQAPTLFGGNTGTVNSFLALDVPSSLLRGELLTPEEIGAKGEGLVCLLRAGLTAGTPGLIGGLSNLPVDALNFLGKTVLPMLDEFSCA